MPWQRLLCPACGRNTIRLKLKPRGEDVYECMFHRANRQYRSCGWWAFADETASAEDRAKLALLKQANPYTDI